jgi:hypothetical protein
MIGRHVGEREKERGEERREESERCQKHTSSSRPTAGSDGKRGSTENKHGWVTDGGGGEEERKDLQPESGWQFPPVGIAKVLLFTNWILRGYVCSAMH